MLKKVNKKVLLITAILILGVSVFTCYKVLNPSISEGFKTEIDSRIAKLALTNNTTGKEGYFCSFNRDSDDYKYIVRHGRKSLKYLVEKIENSNVDGVQEYIAAAACTDILGSKVKKIEWSTGKEWVKKYTALK